MSLFSINSTNSHVNVGMYQAQTQTQTVCVRYIPMSIAVQGLAHD